MKLAVIFPGIGYHTDKPLLYHSKRLAKENGYDIKELSYSQLPTDVKGNEKQMDYCVELAIEQAKQSLGNIDFADYDEILFISKSIGTAVAAACSNAFNLSTRNVYYTPIAQSFRYMKQSGIVFHGTADDWVSTHIVTNGCEQLHLPLHVIEGVNHSLEGNDVIKNIEILLEVMNITKEYILS